MAPLILGQFLDIDGIKMADTSERRVFCNTILLKYHGQIKKNKFFVSIDTNSNLYLTNKNKDKKSYIILLIYIESGKYNSKKFNGSFCNCIRKSSKTLKFWIIFCFKFFR